MKMAQECSRTNLPQETSQVKIKKEHSSSGETKTNFNFPKPQDSHKSATRTVPVHEAPKPAPALPKTNSQPPEPPSIDEPSARGVFGWSTIGGVHLPFILRGNEKFIAARMMECKLIYKYLGVLPWSIFSCTNIKSYYITETEAKLLNEINGFHCEYQFGYELFVVHDVVVPLQDAVKLYEFLETCQKYLMTPDGFAGADKCCGFVLLCGSPVPYIKRGESKLVPVELVQNDVMLIQVQQHEMEEWDAAYLKFLCIVLGQDASRIKPRSMLCSTDDLKWDSRLCPLHIAEWKPPYQMPLLNVKKLAGQSIYGALNSGYLFGTGGDWNSASKFSPQDFDSLYVKKSLSDVNQKQGTDCKVPKLHHSSDASAFFINNNSEKSTPRNDRSSSLPTFQPSLNNLPQPMSKTLLSTSHLTSGEASESVGKSTRKTEPASKMHDSAHFLKPSGPSSVTSPYTGGAFLPPSLMIAEAALKSNLLPGQQLCNQASNNTLTALMQDPFFLQWYSSALVTGTLGLPSLMPSVCGTGNDRETLNNAVYSLQGMQNYASSPNISSASAKLSVPNNTSLASFLSTPSPQYPTPPQSCPLTMHLSSSSVFPTSISSSDASTNLSSRLSGKVDLCSPPPTPEGVSINSLHHLVNPPMQEDVYITPDDHGGMDRRHTECTAQETVVDGHLLTAAVDSHQATRCSVLITDLSRILPGLSKEVCSFALENLLGKSLPVCNRLHVEAFAKKGKKVSEGEKLVDVEELKICLPQLKLLLRNMQTPTDKMTEQFTSFSAAT